MCQPFIRNYQYNEIRKQAESVLRALRSVGDPKIVDSVRCGAELKVKELFQDLSTENRTLLEAITELRTAEELHSYLQSLEPYLIPFPALTEGQIRKLFPKNKKLKLPNLSDFDWRYLTYLSWNDIATGKKFIVYHNGEQFLGIEGRFTATNKKSYCFACNRYEELVLYSAVTKKRPAQASSDYYKSVGHYVCADGHTCNSNMTDAASLEKFIHSVLG
ncbi:FusB/FusC family EF-G-binding protein [Paenibacillus soyae]|uniref:FusB/FusC family EF-G-binding protein n=1 Tax=Paenibacillus soyae TaxID=2969249 RepID=A0A9X2MWC8_9BACL|nr:FusB/FusC family EF-G-binding protein [Paenibacillus soyae]MCR2807554.1 FusB/FusC family EF-G-binding protein [Paenibacillus soyae]